ncbi:hypothetical protein DUA64_15625 [Salmonella enterica subsp. enterica serovar Abony]|nr:hypothetical protein [Salmonella enterica subsp. enterica serovar Abony]EBY6399623.1 hypothetical protein [Salmonella enterica subsp. enterica serovar Abony]
MTTITKERIELFIKNPLENGLARGEQMDLARIAMASLDAEPVRYLNKFSGVCVTLEQQPNASDDVAVYIPLYAAPPAPVVPEECPEEIRDLMASHSDALFNDDDAQEIWNACRAAMLQGDTFRENSISSTNNFREIAETSTNSPVIPDDWVMVPKEPTQAMIKAWLSEVANFRGHAAGYRAALAASPQREIRNYA